MLFRLQIKATQKRLGSTSRPHSRIWQPVKIREGWVKYIWVPFTTTTQDVTTKAQRLNTEHRTPVSWYKQLTAAGVLQVLPTSNIAVRHVLQCVVLQTSVNRCTQLVLHCWGTSSQCSSSCSKLVSLRWQRACRETGPTSVSRQGEGPGHSPRACIANPLYQCNRSTQLQSSAVWM